MDNRTEHRRGRGRMGGELGPWKDPRIPARTTPMPVELVHVLVAHRASYHPAPRSSAEARRRAEALRARVHAGEDLAVLAPDFTDEPFGQRRDGALRVPAGVEGPFGPVRNVPVGAVEIRESVYGFHVIERRA